MNLGLTGEQEMLCESLARFLDSESSCVRGRAAMAAGGFDRALWEGLAGLGVFAMRVLEAAGGLGIGYRADTPVNSFPQSRVPLERQLRFVGF
jgi:alkylation response protein AidB-like acyl-CoA dehydrogenase